MNKRLFEAELILQDDTREHLAKVLDIRYETINRKINTGTFTQAEINKIIDSWKLSPDQAYNIFFSKEVS